MASSFISHTDLPEPVEKVGDNHVILGGSICQLEPQNDLRWIIRLDNTPAIGPYANNEAISQQTEKVLQQRWAAYNHQVGVTYGYTEWREVPVMADESS